MSCTQILPFANQKVLGPWIDVENYLLQGASQIGFDLESSLGVVYAGPVLSSPFRSAPRVDQPLQ